MPLRWRFACPGIGVGAMGDDSEFWREDAAAIAQRPASNVLRMPEASTVLPSGLVGSHATPSADYRSDAFRQYSTSSTLICMVFITIAFGCVVWWLQPDRVTLKEFKSLDDGMTVEQCNAVIGQSGTVEVTASGMKQASEVITWTNANGSQCEVTFINGRKLFGVQSGLK